MGILKRHKCILILPMVCLLMAGCVSAASKEAETKVIEETTEEETANAAETTETAETEEKAASQHRSMQVLCEGGSGRGGVTSPAEVTVTEDGVTARIEMSSANYDYVLLEGQKYLPVSVDPVSTFEIPLPEAECSVTILADTTVMSAPHEIEYHLTFLTDGEDRADRSDGMDAEEDTVGVDLQALSCVPGPEVLFGSKHLKTLELERARGYRVDGYENGKLITIAGEHTHFWLVAKEAQSPTEEERTAEEEALRVQTEDKNLSLVILPEIPERIYLAASAVMDMLVNCDALDHVLYSGIKKQEWFLEKPKEAMQTGRLLYAGKYSAPDYERLYADRCDLAIENTMIYHSPQVKEQLETFGIPVLVDRSSYEVDPLGRMEWIKLYGVLTDHETEAEAAYEVQKRAFDELQDLPKSGTTTAWFYLNSNGAAVIRRADDYIAQMITMAGGQDVFADLSSGEAGHGGTRTIQIEVFYSLAKDAEVLIYNNTIGDEVDSLAQLLQKQPLLRECRAVQKGHVYCAGKNLYQSSMELGAFVTDLYRALNGQAPETYLRRLQ